MNDYERPNEYFEQDESQELYQRNTMEYKEWEADYKRGLEDE